MGSFGEVEMQKKKVNRVLAKLGNDGFSLAIFRAEASDSKEFNG